MPLTKVFIDLLTYRPIMAPVLVFYEVRKISFL